MDAFISRLGAQALNMALRSGIALTSTFFISQCSRIIQRVDDGKLMPELTKLLQEFELKSQVLSPAIDLIEYKSGNGNASLESVAPLARSLRQDINAMGLRLEQTASNMDETASCLGTQASPKDIEAKLRGVMTDVRNIIDRIDREVHMMHIAISTSGETLSSTVSSGISPSRFVQASAFLNIGDTQYACDPTRPVQIGPSFTLSLYMLFLGHANRRPDVEGDSRKPLWQEVIHKSRVRICRTPLDHVFDSRRGYCPVAESSSNTGVCKNSQVDPCFSNIGTFDGFAYHLEIVENLDDGRVHDEMQTEPLPFDGISRPGIRESLPVHQISKIFYADTGRLLNIGNNTQPDNNPVLLLKRDVTGRPPADLRMEMAFGSADFQNKYEYGCEREETIETDEQHEVDRQLEEESLVTQGPQISGMPDGKLAPESFPAHVDPEWIALEVFEEAANMDDGSHESDDDDDGDSIKAENEYKETPRLRSKIQNHTLDSEVIDQIRQVSLSNPPFGHGKPSQPCPETHVDRLESTPKHQLLTSNASTFIARSPFAMVTTSLSLLEMLIRLTSLQEFQQASHLTIDDHTLNFFLEQTSTTGLKGEERRRARSEAKRRVGFDPYLDSPSN